jgi:hypothetical protein
MDQRYWLIIGSLLFSILILILLLIVDRSRRRNETLATELTEIGSRSKDLDNYKAELVELRDRLSEQIVLGVMNPELAADCADVYGKITTGHPLLDSLLMQKLAFCQESGVRFDCEIQQLTERLDDRDLVGLFSNLLDNAIDAAMRYTAATGETGWVRTKARRVDRQWTLTVENAKPATEYPLEEGMRSTKKAAGEHGLGSKIIDRVTRKNKGFVRRTDRGESFLVLVTMPMEDMSTTHHLIR